MNIAIVATAPYAVGGVSRVIESWARVLLRGGHSVTVLMAADERAPRSLNLEGVREAWFDVDPAAHFWGKLRGSMATSAVRALAKVDRRSKIDLIVLHDAAAGRAIRRRFSTTPLLLTVHSPFVDENRLNNWKYARSFWRRLTYPATWARAWEADRSGLRAASSVHTLSRYTWSLLGARYPTICPTLSWRAIPGTFDDQRFTPCADRREVRRRLGLDPDERILLSVRRLVPRNAVERILVAADRLREQRGIRFLIGGVGELYEPLRRRVERESLGGIVQMLGLVPEADLAAYYQAADAFLMPTRDLECFGLPVIEAMACGCTPLVTPGGGPAEICQPFPACIAAANSTDAFVDLVARYVSGRIPASIDGIAGHARAHYSEEAVRPAILDLVERLDGTAGGDPT